MPKIDIVFDLDQTLVDSHYLGMNDQEIEENLYKLKKEIGGILDINKVFIIKYFFNRSSPRHLRVLTMKRGIDHIHKTIKKPISSNDSNNKPMMISYAVFIRPYAKQLLSWCFNNANVSVWTAGTSDYAMNIISGLFSQHQQKKLKLILTRDSMNRGFVNINTNKIYKVVNNKRILVKNMNLLFKHPDFLVYKFSNASTVLIDDLQSNYDTNKKAGTIRNMIKIAAWSRRDVNDDKLLKLRMWLITRNKLLHNSENSILNSRINSNTIMKS